MTPTISGVRFFDPGRNYLKHKSEIDVAISDVLTRGDLILRRDMEEFERELASFVGTKYAVALNSGTDALYLTLWALGIGKGDEVLLPSHTFVATAQVVHQLGATPVLYDMDNNVEINKSTKAIIVAHIAGEITVDMNLVLEMANHHQISVIEDACQALGATQNGRMAGSMGITGCFSFYPAKLLGSYGDAGAIVTNDEHMYKEIKNLRNHCKDSNFDAFGVNSRMDNVQAAVLNVKFKHFPAALLRRAQIAKQYDEAFVDLPVTPPRAREGRVYQDYVILFNTNFERENAVEKLKHIGIETMRNEYPMPIKKTPLSVDYEARSLRIPCNENLTDEEVEYVITGIKSLFS